MRRDDDDDGDVFVPDEGYSHARDRDPIDDGYNCPNWTDNDALDAQYGGDDE